MNAFLDTLKARMSEAQGRLQNAKQKLNAAQSEYDAASKETASWQNAVEIETKKVPATLGATPAFVLKPEPEEDNAQEQGTNKTQLIRSIIRSHPAGITPSDIWKMVRNQIVHRPYVYSVLKRLKDKNAITLRRGKYYSVVTPDEQEGDKGRAIVQ